MQLPDANALEVAERVRAKMDELANDFPDDLKYAIMFDTTPYTSECIDEVFKALRDAVLLVALVVLLFLQNWPLAVIPLIAVPVAIVGTFAVLFAFGFSLNNLTLFGLVLAIGIVVNDAIVVVEAVEHHIEQGLKPRRYHQGHEPSLRAGGCCGACAQRGVRALRVYQRADGAVLPPVRLDDRRLDDYFHVQLADLEPGVSACCSASATRKRTRRCRDWHFRCSAAGRATSGLPLLTRWLERVWPLLPAGVLAWAVPAAGWIAGGAAVAAGANRRLVDRSARRHGLAQSLPLVQRRRFVHHERLHPRGRRFAATQRDRVACLCRAVVCHLQGIYDRTEGLHPRAGHGLPLRRRAVAGCGLDRTRERRRAPRAADCDEDARRQAYDGHRGKRLRHSARWDPISA